MATPPARVPLRISLMLNRPRAKIEVAKAERQLPVRETIVLEIIRERWKLLVGKKPALKEGQNIQRKKVPITANVELTQLSWKGLEGHTLQPMTTVKASPKKAPKA